MFKQDVINFRGNHVMVKLGEYSFWLESGKYFLEVEPAHDDIYDTGFDSSISFREAAQYYDDTDCPTWMYDLAGQIEEANYDPKSGRRNGRI